MDALEFGRRIRAELASLGSTPEAMATRLLELGVKGRKGDECNCPLARHFTKAIGQPVQVYDDGCNLADYDYEGPPLQVTWDGVPRRFLSLFDGGEFPQLVEADGPAIATGGGEVY